jgi:hypothetical protein
MEKIDRLGWAAGISVVSYGLRIGVRSNNNTVLDRVRERLPVGWKPADSPAVDNLYSILAPRGSETSKVRRFNLLYKGVGRLSRTMDLDELLHEFEIDVHSYVAALAKRRIFLRAGVVGWRGQAIVLLEQNLDAESSLVGAFVRSGATYYSDEFAVLDSHGLVHPYPWRRRTTSRRIEGSRLVLSSANIAAKPLPIALIVSSTYRPGAKWRPRSMSKGKAALALFTRVMSERQSPENLIRRLGQVASAAKVIKGMRGEADNVVDSILKQL